jgi:hypothetical protein
MDSEGKSAQLRLVAGETKYLLVIGIRGLIDPAQFDGEGVLLVNGVAPMSKEDWCQTALSISLKEALPYLTPQQELA